MTPTPPQKMLTMAELVDIFRVSDSTIERWITKGWFPPGIKGGKERHWLQADLAAVQHLMGRGVWPPGEEEEKPEKS